MDRFKIENAKGREIIDNGYDGLRELMSTYYAEARIFVEANLIMIGDEDH